MSAKSILAYLSDASDRRVVEQMAERRQMNVRVESGTLQHAADHARGWRVVPEFLIIDVSDLEDVPGLFDQLAQNAPDGETNLIAVGADDTVETYRAYKRLGVAEYIVRPLDADTLSDIIGDILKERLKSGLSLDSGRLLCVHGVRGGAGGSTIAAAVARAISESHRKRVFLIDLDLGHGTQYLNFGTDDTPGLIDMCENPARIDALFIERSLERPLDRLSLLSAHRESGPLQVDDETLKQIIIQAQRAADMVVLDIPFRAHAGADLLAQASFNVLVTQPTIQGMRDTAAALAYLEQVNFGGEVSVVLNKAGEFKDGEVGRVEFAKRISAKHVIDIPYDARAAGRSMISNQTLYAAVGKLGRKLKQLYARLPTAMADAGKRAKTGWFGR